MSDNLRSKVIRLAHQQPSLRPHLLPLLKTAAMDATKAKGLAMLTDALKATPGLSVRTSGTKMVVSAGKLNPEVKSIEFNWSGDGMEIPFVMTLKNGMKGWGWDAYRTPPSFYDTQNKLKLQVVFDGKRDPESELRDFVTHLLLVGVRRAGLVFVPKTSELITLTEAAARSKPTAPKPTATNPSVSLWSKADRTYAIKLVTRKGETLWTGDGWKHSMDFSRDDTPVLFASEADARKELVTKALPYIARWQPGYWEDFVRGWEVPSGMTPR